LRVTILGSGGSTGTPAIDKGWGRSDPSEPRNRRTRPSILVEEGPTRLLVDTSPDLRQQLLAAGVATLTAVFYTHAHADHLHGIDDLRAVNRAIGAALDIYADRKSLDIIHRRFAYVFTPLEAGSCFFYKPVLVPHEIRAGEPVQVGDIEVLPFEQEHGFSRTLGFRFGPVAYSTDVVDLSEDTFALLAGIDVWIIGTLTDTPHPTHCHVGKALDWIERLKPRRAVLTHLGLDLDHATLSARLPAGVEPAFDGMVIETAAPNGAIRPRPASGYQRSS
jgi:phosphoribosyl 1,2-cyclic phosphate phosphodiesterase